MLMFFTCFRRHKGPRVIVGECPFMGPVTDPTPSIFFLLLESASPPLLPLWFLDPFFLFNPTRHTLRYDGCPPVDLAVHSEKLFNPFKKLHTPCRPLVPARSTSFWVLHLQCIDDLKVVVSVLHAEVVVPLPPIVGPPSLYSTVLSSLVRHWLSKRPPPLPFALVPPPIAINFLHRVCGSRTFCFSPSSQVSPADHLIWCFLHGPGIFFTNWLVVCVAAWAMHSFFPAKGTKKPVFLVPPSKNADVLR